jgi:TolB protein
MRRPSGRFVMLLMGMLALLGSSLACSFAGTRLPGLSIAPGRPDSAGLIVYVGSDGNIYTTDKSGDRVQSVTSRESNSSVVYLFPTWSPDGRRLSYISLEKGSGLRQISRIFTVDPDGKGQVEVFHSDEQQPFYFYWSPDSQSISFLSSFSSGDGLILQVVPARGGNPRTLGVGQPFYWDWSPDGRTVSIHTGGAAADSQEARLAILALDDKLREDELTLRPAAFQAPAWSPDGQELLLAVEDGVGTSGLLLLRKDGVVERQVQSIDGPVAFAWSPDGSRLVYLHGQSEEQGSMLRGLRLINIADASQPVTIAEAGVVAFFWSPDSSQVAYFVPLLSDVSPQEQGVSYSAMRLLPAQPDRVLRLSLMIYDIQSGQSRQAAVFEPADEFLNLLPFFDQYARSSTIWSLDSRYLVVSGLDLSGNPGIYLVTAAGDQPIKRIADGNLAFWSRK